MSTLMVKSMLIFKGMTHTQFLLKRLVSTDAVVWSPQTDNQSIKALSNLLAAAQEQANAYSPK
jgi:hypothetical protein